jgi:hypothetical protein
MKKKFNHSTVLQAFLMVWLYLLSSCHHSENNSLVLPSSEKGDVAIAWYKLQLKIILNANPAISPTVVARIFGYVGIGLYESVRNEIKTTVSLNTRLYQMPAMPAVESNQGYSWSVSANATLAKLVRSMYPNLTAQNTASIDSLENTYNDTLKPNVESTVFERSQAYGQSIADAIFSWSKTDNDNQSNAGYVIPVFDGAWVPTPPAFAPPAAPFLGNARPFLQEDAQGLAPAFAFPYSVDPASDFYKMVKDIYDVSQTLTNDQKSVALFWNDIGVKKGYTPPGHSISILNQILDKEQASLALASHAYAKIGIALRDATILIWRSKYAYNQIRPVSYIRKAINPNWLPFIGTPPHPEYPAAHAYVTAAAMQTLTGLFGNNYPIIDNTYNFLGFSPRSYATLNDAAMESGMSRRFGGIHYLPSIQTGLTLGTELGTRVANIQLTDHKAD